MAGFVEGREMRLSNFIPNPMNTMVDQQNIGIELKSLKTPHCASSSSYWQPWKSPFWPSTVKEMP
jgi:hypothetical protein